MILIIVTMFFCSMIKWTFIFLKTCKVAEISVFVTAVTKIHFYHVSCFFCPKWLQWMKEGFNRVYYLGCFWPIQSKVDYEPFLKKMFVNPNLDRCEVFPGIFRFCRKQYVTITIHVAMLSSLEFYKDNSGLDDAI